MSEQLSDLEQALEEAFDYRGHVLLTLTDDTTVEGFLFNRVFEHHPRNCPPYVELFLKGNASKLTVPIERIQAVEKSGVDHATE